MTIADKRELRRWAAERRRGLDPAWRARAEQAAAANAIQFIEEKKANSAALFASFGDEIDTHQLIKALLARGIGVALPLVVRGEKRIEMRAVNQFPEACRPGAYGILEPDPAKCPRVPADALDIIFVPGLLFTREGWRLGYGGGYYDRLLKENRHALAVAYGFSTQIVETLPREKWDQRVLMIIDDAGIHPTIMRHDEAI
ncbi:MAG: 5-formyltetrahydrofolate cyclo-ligase [Candidatus Sumerlaeia bacterium]